MILQMSLLLLGDQQVIVNQYEKGRGGRFGLLLKGWGYDKLSTSCLKQYPNKIDMSIKKVNKIYTKYKKSAIVR